MSHPTEQPDHLDEHRRLMTRLADFIDRGEDVPCTSDPTTSAWWTSDAIADQRAAARLCNDCPAFRECSNYITEQAERCGVWAGTTPGERNGKQT